MPNSARSIIVIECVSSRTLTSDSNSAINLILILKLFATLT